MIGIYNFFASIYFLGIKLFSKFNLKAHHFVEGRKNWEKNLSKLFPIKKKVIWFHCASLGEFEQGRPVMELFKKENPEYFLLLTFFSPSGYEVQKNYSGADAVFYLPTDSGNNAKKFIEIVSPSIVVFVKYEFWFGFISEINNRNVPLIFISCIFRENHFLFKWYGRWLLNYLKNCKMIFVQNENSFNYLKKENFINIQIANDTRFDRVYENSKKIDLPSEILEWANNKDVFVFGSTWNDDEKIIKVLFENLKKINSKIGFIIVPHEVGNKHLKLTTNLFVEHKLKLLSSNSFRDAEIMVIDKIGLLSKLYSLCKIAYVGGGLGKGVHNLLEPAVFGVPVVFGKNNTKFEEAQKLKQMKAGIEISDSNSLFVAYKYFLENKEILFEAGENAKKYVSENVGGSKNIVNYINQIISKPI
jgi:3-deoxy-D-manno-octulosonic-acid transferase